jgi:hypothetical protein
MVQSKMSSEDVKVKYFFVGVGKCGTSWLYEFLKRHDLVSVPTLKEPYLIDESPERQAAIIEKLYSRTEGMADFSNTYYWDLENAQKIKDYNPDARIVITTRLPSKRIISHFGFLRRNGLVSEETVAEYLAGNDPEEIVARSHYRRIIERYVAAFGENKVIVLPLEQLQQEPQLYADRLCSFLDIRQHVLDENDIKPVLKKARARSVILARSAKFLANGFRRFGLLTLLGHLKSSKLIRSLLFTEAVGDEKSDFGQHHQEIEKLDADYLNLLAENGVILNTNEM